MGKLLTNEEFLNRVQDLFGYKYEVLEEYKGSRYKLLVKCNDCGLQWKTKNLWRGYGCPKCGLNKAISTKKWHLTQTDFLAKIPKDFKEQIEILGTYKHQHCRIPVRCKKCGREWESTPCYLYKKYGCAVCGRQRKGVASRKTHEYFVQEVEKVHGDGIKILSRYVTGEKRIKVECRQCGHRWEPVAQRLLRRGCPECYSSKGEKKIERILSENNIIFKREYTFEDLRGQNNSRLRFDFAIFNDVKLIGLIEYDGLQHYRAFEFTGGEERYKRQRKNDDMKNNYCKMKSIPLLRICYKDYSKIDFESIISFFENKGAKGN